MAASPSYYEIVVNGRPYLLPAHAVVANAERGAAEMISDDAERPVGWLTVAYRRVPVFSLRTAFPGVDAEWTHALIVQAAGGEPVGLAVEAARPADARNGVAVDAWVPGNRFPGGPLVTQALLEGERLRLIIAPERLSAYLHLRPRI